MTETAGTQPGKLFRTTAVIASATTYLLIVFGAIVRVSGSGLGCGVSGQSWPLCHGGLVPPPDLPTLIEFNHRIWATVVSILVVILFVLALAKYRHFKHLMWGTTLGLVLLIIQIALGAVTVEFDLPGTIVMAHLANAELLFAVMLYLAVVTRSGEVNRSWHAQGMKCALYAAGAVYLLVLSGALVVSQGAGAACFSWPLCGGGLGAPTSLLADYNVAHRVFALAGVIFAVIASSRTLKLWRGLKPLTVATRSLHGLLGLQLLVGAAMVLASLQPALRGLHIAVASAAWGAAVLIVLFVHTAKAK